MKSLKINKSNVGTTNHRVVLLISLNFCFHYRSSIVVLIEVSHKRFCSAMAIAFQFEDADSDGTQDPMHSKSTMQQ